MQLRLLLPCVVRGDCQKALDIPQQRFQTVFRLLGLLLLWRSRRTVAIVGCLTGSPSYTRYAWSQTITSSIWLHKWLAKPVSPSKPTVEAWAADRVVATIAAVVALDIVLVVLIVSGVVIVGSDVVVDGSAQVICIAGAILDVWVNVRLRVAVIQCIVNRVGVNRVVDHTIASAVNSVASRTEVECGRGRDVLLLLLRQKP